MPGLTRAPPPKWQRSQGCSARDAGHAAAAWARSGGVPGGIWPVDTTPSHGVPKATG